MTVDAPALVADLLDDPPAALTRHGDGIPELAAMRGCPQPPNHHAEGDVWTHTRLALEAAADLPAAVDRHAGAALVAAGLAPLALPRRTLTATVAVLLHDAAKPVTIAGGAQGWTYYGHDAVGAELARGLLGRLQLSRAAAAAGAKLDVDAVCWLVREHLFWLNTDVGRVTDRAVARRFVRDDGRDEDLRLLSWCDTLGSLGPDGRPAVGLLVDAEARLAASRARAAEAAARPAPLLDGEAVMAALGLEPGPRVGAVLAHLRQVCTGEDSARRRLRDDAAWLRAAPLSELRARNA